MTQSNNVVVLVSEPVDSDDEISLVKKILDCDEEIKIRQKCVDDYDTYIKKLKAEKDEISHALEEALSVTRKEVWGLPPATSRAMEMKIKLISLEMRHVALRPTDTRLPSKFTQTSNKEILRPKAIYIKVHPIKKQLLCRLKVNEGDTKEQIVQMFIPIERLWSISSADQKADLYPVIKKIFENKDESIKFYVNLLEILARENAIIPNPYEEKLKIYEQEKKERMAKRDQLIANAERVLAEQTALLHKYQQASATAEEKLLNMLSPGNARVGQPSELEPAQNSPLLPLKPVNYQLQIVNEPGVVESPQNVPWAFWPREDSSQAQQGYLASQRVEDPPSELDQNDSFSDESQNTFGH